jgi:hypothetical protein
VQGIVGLLMASQLALFGLTLLPLLGGAELVERDWRVLQLAVQRVLAGEPLYVPSSHGELTRFLYPPYGVWYFLPLALVSGAATYGVVVLAQLAAVAATVRLVGSRARPLLVGGLVGSAGLSFGLFVGQFAPSYLLAYALAAWLWQRDRPWAAGLVGGLVALKPHFVWPLVWVAAFASPQVFGGLALCGVGLALASVPLGLGAWFDWIALAREHAAYASEELIVAQNATLVGFLRGLVGAEASQWAWRAALPVGVLAAALGARRQRGSPFTVVSLAVLLAVSLNPYVNTYDLVLLFLPAAVWAEQRDRVPAWAWSGVWVALGLCWLWDLWVVWYSVLVGAGRVSVGSASGALAYGWLLLWVGSSLAEEAPPTRATPATSSTSPTSERSDQGSLNTTTPEANTMATDSPV